MRARREGAREERTGARARDMRGPDDAMDALRRAPAARVRTPRPRRCAGGGGGGGQSQGGGRGGNGAGGFGGDGFTAVDGNYYCGGGGGGCREINYAEDNILGPNDGGLGGGGGGSYRYAGPYANPYAGPATQFFNAQAGATNTGGGGGGGATTGHPGDGGSGVCFVYYPNTFAQASATTGNPTYSNTGGNHVYKFTGSGSITF